MLQMKYKFSFFIPLLIMWFAGYTQDVPAPYEVAVWSGFREAAINYTFDDGCPNQFSIAIPLFNEFDFDLTLFTVTNWTSDWARLVAAADSGHEVASHTVTHTNFGDISADQEDTELKNSRDIIESQIPGKRCITMAYPYCVPGVDTVIEKYYLSARSCQNFIEPRTPGSYFNISSIVCGNLGSVNTLSDFKAKFNAAANMKGWCVFLFHGIDGDGGYSPITSAELRKSIEYLDPRRSKYWVTTFANSTLYSLERNAVQVTEIAATDTSMILQVTDALPDSVFNYPLTFRRPLPPDWPSASVIQDSVPVPMRIVLIDTVVYLTFDVIPDSGEVLITKNSTPVTPEVDTIPEDEPDPLSLQQAENIHADIQVAYLQGTLIITWNTLPADALEVCLFDTRGMKVMSRQFQHLLDNKISFDLTANDLTEGVYLVYVSDGQKGWGKKIVIG
jgi:peptidoglycan-N-acetylglucosamine deacetylase